MPTKRRIGVVSTANDAIGGIPVLHYLDIFSQGRGQVLRLFCIDAGIAFDDVRYSEEEFSVQKHGFISQMNPLAKVPIVELDGKIFTQSYAILRHFARLLGKYGGDCNYEKYFCDALCDIAIDWRTRFVDALLSPNPEADLAKYRQTTGAEFLRAVETHLSSSSFSYAGPFVLGCKISYSDFVIYQILHDEELTKDQGQRLKMYPRIAKLAGAVEARENVKAYMQSDEYRG